ncbi:MAG TPA: PilN domain-containing protein [Gammaproteobacteria bacterium]|nr:PilN domain-containing protein [Gammaproteobacteria bacterium]
MIFFTSLLRGVGITLAGLIAWHLMLSGLVNFQLEENLQRRLLITEKILDIAEYEKRQQKIVSSQMRLNFITRLRHQNEEAAQILKELTKSIPQTITLARVSWQDGVILINGYTHSDLELIAWMGHIRNSPILVHPLVTAISDSNQLRYFQLKVGLKG